MSATPDPSAHYKSEIQRLQSIIDGTRAGTWEWNVQTGETRFNERWANMLGYSLAELEPTSIDTWLALTHPDDLTISEKRLAEYFAGTTDFYECVIRMRHKQGQWVWIEDRGKLISRSADNKPEWMTGTHIDVTEAHSARLERDEVSRRIEKISATIPGVIYQFTLSPEGVLGFPCSSEGMEQIYGVSQEEVREDAEILKKIIHPDDLERVLDGVIESAEQLTVWHDEYRVIIDGKVEWREGHSTPERMADGGTIWHGIIMDVTHRKKLEQELGVYQGRLEQAQAIAQIGCWEADIKHQSAWWSDINYDIFGLPRDYELTM